MPRHFVQVCAACLAFASMSVAHAQTLKTAVSLAGSNATTDTMEVQVPAGRMSLDLYFYPTAAIQSPSQGKLAVTNLRATTAPGEVLSAKATIVNGTANGIDGSAFDVTLTTGDPLRIAVSAENLRPGAAYKSIVYLTALKETRQWELTLTAGGRGTLVVESVPALQFERPFGLWLCEWVGCAPRPLGEFTLGLRNKTPFGPLTNLHVRFDPGATTASKTLRSNFTIDNLVFSTADNPLEGKAASEVKRTGNTAGALGAIPGVLLDTTRSYKVAISGLKPGEYAGALRFTASEALEDTADSRLALAINVRDPQIVPVAVLIIGSLIGWFTTKYLVAARKARDMARSVQVLRDRADDLARDRGARKGWQFSKEATSYTLIRVRVVLNRLAAVTKSGLPMLVHETELTRLKDDAEARLTRLEALREMRLQIQVVADNRPTVQQVVGRMLRRASDMLADTAFGTTQQAAFTAELANLQPWLAADTRLQKYRDALAARSTEVNVGFTLSDINAPVRAHVEGLLKNWPTVAELTAADTTVATLQPFDQRFETLALLRREHRAEWVQLLADGCDQGLSLNGLFDIVDEQFWKELEKAGPAMTCVRELAHRDTVDCYDIIEMHLEVPGIDPSRMRKHPLRVVWTIEAPGSAPRVVETDDLTLVQHFAQPGTAKVSAQLQWSGHQPIDVPKGVSVHVARKAEYGKSNLITQGGVVELAAVGIAILFAVVTAMQTQYDSTFGSTAQYLGLFIWAAGAATGGNVLKQLGTSNTPGGQADATLPAKP